MLRSSAFRPPRRVDLYDPEMLHYGPRVGTIGLLAVALTLTVIGAVLSRPGLELGGGLLMVLAVASFLLGRS